MKSSLLQQFLNRAISAENLASELTEEVNLYTNSLAKRGSSAEVFLLGDTEIKIGYSEVIVLCNAYLEGAFSRVALSYVCDALDMFEKVSFQSGWVEEAVSSIADPEVHDTADYSSIKLIRDGAKKSMKQ